MDEQPDGNKLRKAQKGKFKQERKTKALQKEKAKPQAREKNPNKKVVEDENPEDSIALSKCDRLKKLLAPKMARHYKPKEVEELWYAWWESSGFFKRDYTSTKPTFVMVLQPPPNVTGICCIGYFLIVAMQDVMIRWYRMSGHNALWILVDHAGIATKVSEWKEVYSDTMLTEFRRLGVSFDWSCKDFTMDERTPQAVNEAFLRSRENVLVSFCPNIDEHGQEKKEPRSNATDPLEVLIDGMPQKILLKHAQEVTPVNELSNASEDLINYPDGIIECGADALRFALFSCVDKHNRLKLDTEEVIRSQEWCCKLWNATRVVMDKLDDDYMPPAALDISLLPPFCRWILSTLDGAIRKTIASLGTHDFHGATSAIYSWWQKQLRNVFLEGIKPYFNESQEFESARANSRHTLWSCLHVGLRLLHPFMPYVTEELWQRLPQLSSCMKRSIMVSEYPVVQSWADDELEHEMDMVLGVVKKLKDLKQKAKTCPYENERLCAFAHCQGEEVAAIMERYELQIITLSSISNLKIVREGEVPSDCECSVVNEHLSVYLKIVDPWLEQLRKKKAQYLKRQSACEVEQKSDMSELGHSPPLTLDNGSEIRDRFLFFLREYKVNGNPFYKIISKALAAIQVSEMSINFKHLQQFDSSLAKTIHMFFGSVQTDLTNAAKVYLAEDIGYQCEKPVLTISDRPTPRSFMPIAEFWDLPGCHPSEECTIYCGEMTLTVVRTTQPGRIVLVNLLMKIFGNYENGNSWNGNWTITDVMVCSETYAVEIIKPFHHARSKFDSLLKDLLVVADHIVPLFECSGQLPAFFDHFDRCLRGQVRRYGLSDLTLRKFKKLLIVHFALKPPLTRSTFLDYLHEILQSLGKFQKSVLHSILTNYVVDWRGKDLFTLNPVLAVVSEHNRRKKHKNEQRDLAGKADSQKNENRTGDVDVGQTNVPPQDGHEVPSYYASLVQEIDIQTDEVAIPLNEDGDGDDDKFPFENRLDGLLIFSRHIKQHGTKGSRDDKGLQKIMELSEIDLVMSHFLNMLPEILVAVIFLIDREEFMHDPVDYDAFLVMFWEIFEVYIRPETITKSQEESESFPFVSHSKDSSSCSALRDHWDGVSGGSTRHPLPAVREELDASSAVNVMIARAQMGEKSHEKASDL